jgi:hypothetical protein
VQAALQPRSEEQKTYEKEAKKRLPISIRPLRSVNALRL